MTTFARALAFVLPLVFFAGCTGGPDEDPAPGGDVTEAPLAEGKGGIKGLVIDDVFRPIPGALVLIQSFGHTATSNADGEFAFTGLTPGSYTLVTTAAGHEAGPVTVDVEAGKYAEAQVPARRIFSEGGTIITTHYSVFVPCGASYVAGSYVVNCLGDLSGDSYRAGFEADYTGHGENVTYLVTEMKANAKASSQDGALKVVVRELGNGDYWGSKFTVDSDYIKITMRLGNVSLDDAEPGRNVAWNNDKKMETILFPQGSFKGETQGALDAACPVTDPLPQDTCFESRGLGPRAGIKANFVQSLFLGEPATPIEDYHVFGPSE
jgi:hypothetical protein